MALTKPNQSFVDPDVMPLRLMTIVNPYCRGSQAGVQAAHSVATLVAYHRKHPFVDSWLDNEQTIVQLYAPMKTNMEELYDRIREAIWYIAANEGLTGLSIPMTAFAEPELNNTITSISFIAPPHYAASQETAMYCSVDDKLSEEYKLTAIHRLASITKDFRTVS